MKRPVGAQPHSRRQVARLLHACAMILAFGQNTNLTLSTTPEPFLATPRDVTSELAVETICWTGWGGTVGPSEWSRHGPPTVPRPDASLFASILSTLQAAARRAT